MRKKKKEVAIEDLENYTSDLVDKDMGPEEHATKIATRELIEKTLNQMNEKYRMLLILRDIQNLSYKEISEITEMELNTVKVGIYRGRREFQKIYQEMEEL